MSTQNLNHILEKLNSLITNRYGVKVEYFAWMESSAGRKTSVLETAKRNASAPLIIAHNEMIVPMRVDGAFVGAVLVPQIANLKPRDLSVIKSSIDTVLHKALAAQNVFEQMEKALELELVTNNIHSNVRPITSARPLLPLFETGASF
jgi:hypothetical protein